MLSHQQRGIFCLSLPPHSLGAPQLLQLLPGFPTLKWGTLGLSPHSSSWITLTPELVSSSLMTVSIMCWLFPNFHFQPWSFHWASDSHIQLPTWPNLASETWHVPNESLSKRSSRSGPCLRTQQLRPRSSGRPITWTHLWLFLLSHFTPNPLQSPLALPSPCAQNLALLTPLSLPFGLSYGHFSHDLLPASLFFLLQSVLHPDPREGI